MNNDPNVVFEALPGSQSLALDARVDDLLYYGTRGPGKSAVQLMRFRLNVGKGYGSFYKGVIIDTDYKSLHDITSQAKKFFHAFGDGGRMHESAADKRYTWPTGEELLFRHAKKVDDYAQLHGHEFCYVGFNELTKHPTSELYELVTSTMRSSFVPEKHTPRGEDGSYLTEDGLPLPEIPIMAFNTTNPSGVGHMWVKKRYITPIAPGNVLKIETNIYNPRTKKEEIYVKKQVAIFGSYKENPYLPPSYISKLESITDPNKRKAWLYGSWDMPSGGAFDDLWDPAVHVLEKFNIPSGWYIDRSFDWGSTHPFSVGWWAEANGEEVVLPSGKIFAPKKGSLIQIGEWYGCEEIGVNKGLKMSAPDIAKGIVLKEQQMLSSGFIQSKPRPGPADNQISQVRERDVETIEKKMSDHGVIWKKSDKSPGSRINGFQLLRDRFEASSKGEGPGVYFMRTCPATIEILPVLPRDEKNFDDVDTDAEDHLYDMIRYRVLSGSNRIATSLNVKYSY